MRLHTYHENIEHLKAFNEEYQLINIYIPPIDNKKPSKKKYQRESADSVVKNLIRPPLKASLT